MAFNLFDNILQSSTNKFLGTQRSVPSTPSFSTPQAPRTTSYVAPTIVKPSPYWSNPVDQTQSPFYKAVQWGANLFTGVKNRLQETYQSDIDRKQQEMDQKWIKFADHLIKKGYTKEQVFASLDELKKAWELQVSPNFSERLVSGLSNRMGEVQRTTERLANEWFTPKTTITAPISYAGDVVGTAFEPVGALLSPVVQKVIEKTGQTQNVEDVGKWWEWVRQSNPNFADAIEWAMNVSSVLPLSPKVTAPIKSGLQTAGTKAIQTAESLTPNLAKQAKKLTSQAEMWFRKQAEDIAVPKLSEMGMRDKQKVTGDVIETKPWFFKKEELVRSPQEALAIEEVSRMLKEGKIKKGSTELQKASAIESEIGWLAEALKWRLDNTPNQVSISKLEVESLLDDITKNIDKNPFLKAWDLDRSAKQIIANIREKLTKDIYTPSELLEIRKQLDADIKQFKWEKVFWQDIENALSTTIKDFRQWLNNKVAELVPDADVRSFLDRQSALYTALDNVNAKWSKQANSTIGRVLSKIQSATWIPRTEIIELSTALGLLWASSLAPIVAPIAIWATAIAGGKKAIWAILSPKNKVRIANVLTKLDEAIKKNPKDAELLKAKELFSKYNKNDWTTTNIRNTGNNWSSNPQPIIKPKNESKVIKPTSSTNTANDIPEGYTKNVFGEVIKKPWYKKGGFVKIPEIGKNSNNPIINKQTWETLNQAIDKLKKNNWSEKDIQRYKDAVLGKKENIVKKEWILDTVNPTWWLFVEYTPKKRANSIISSKDLTTLDKTLWKSPDDYITIYRGTVKWQKEMNPWDFVTDMPELAKSYAGWDKIVISKKVKYSDIIDSINEWWWNEYLYIPKEMQKWDKKQIKLTPSKKKK